MGLRPHFYMTSEEWLRSNWRDDHGLVCITEYKKKFALWPVKCQDVDWVWLKTYYKEYTVWSSHGMADDYSHSDYINSITEEEYLVRKLVRGF